MKETVDWLHFSLGTKPAILLDVIQFAKESTSGELVSEPRLFNPKIEFINASKWSMS